ncbi:MAG: hypothetical protein HY892_00365 [Deltaproteobacteria bacterium]|nr:hypothetical protein [Deltaproteobacteria bacterium]
MTEMNRAHQGRMAIRAFQVMAHALLLRGRYSLGGSSGQALEAALRTLSPEIYGTMNDPQRIELKGLEYIMDRLPTGKNIAVKEKIDPAAIEKDSRPTRGRVLIPDLGGSDRGRPGHGKL